MKLPPFFRAPMALVYLLLHLLLFMGGVLLTRDPQRQVMFGIGTSLIAAGISGWAIFLYLALADEFKQRLQTLSEAGVLGIFEGRAARIRDEYVNRLKDARRQVDVIGFGLSAFREDFQAEIPQWKDRARVRILILDPEFPSPRTSYAAQRDREEGNPEGKIADECKKFVEDFAGLTCSDPKGSLEIRKYRCLPTINILRVDDELFWGPYLIKQQSRNTPTFLVKRGGFLFDHFTSHFEYIWEHLSEQCIPQAKK